MISFIIPTYNKSQSIIRSIKSVQEQTDSLWELLIIDDGSSDNTREVVEPFLSDVRINYFFQKMAVFPQQEIVVHIWQKENI
jgi:glycosyltransferase involved in cell wall biosynthesis